MSFPFLQKQPQVDRNLPVCRVSRLGLKKRRRQSFSDSLLTVLMNMCMDESAMLCPQTRQSLCRSSPTANLTSQREYVRSSKNSSVAEVKVRLDIQSLISDSDLTGACFVVSMALFLNIAFQGMYEILPDFEGLIAW